MPTYTYQARNEQGTRVAGVVEARDERALEDTLRVKGLFVTAVKENTAKASTASPATPAVSRRDLVLFTVHLATVLNSGIPIVEGLRAYADEAPNRRLKAVAEAVLDGVRGGSSLSETMSRLPRAFPDIYVNLVRAGESVGRVDNVLFDLVNSLEWQARLVSDLRQASIYPLMLLMALSALVIIITTVVMPRFIKALVRANAPVSGLTLWLVTFGDFVNQYWLPIVLLVVGVVVAIRLVLDTPRGRHAFDRVKLRAPLVGDLVRKTGLGRFAHHLSMLHRAGVDFVTALTVVEHVVGNVILAEAIAAAREKVVRGSSLTEAMRASREFPPLVLQMVATGEATATLGETLAKVAEYYDREVPATIKRVSTVVEPLIYVFLGVVVVGVVLTFYAPMLAMMRNLQVRPRF